MGADRRERVRRVLRRSWTLAKCTVLDAREDRMLGLAAEVAFFGLLSIPSLILVVAGAAGYLGEVAGSDVGTVLQRQIERALGTFIAPDTMRETVAPAVRSLFEEGRGGLLSIGAALALWSGSRMVKVLIEALNVAYDVEEWRAGWKRRLLAVGLTFGGIVSITLLLPLVVAGPRLGAVIDDAIGAGGIVGATWRVLYWPAALVVGIAALALLYKTAPNRRGPWIRDVPGAALAAVAWLAAAFGLRFYVDVAFSARSLGPLAAPVVLLLWLHASALAVLLGAELNGEIDKMWPTRAVRQKVTREEREAEDRRSEEGDAA